ncbi:YbjQ family protein [Glaesserella parasuis]|uniref:YbjQ family protein n=1 Tax=Glaesserella parasuis TaxID=738 RepID=UPI00135D861B|nr:YbjQ family protein [Glaesserella parasuis]MCT8516668.1 YbjQ family protein [Glaesserella parasuis]MCT8581372.1 YbjQ family protein [Glaesserella parasuis]MCT8585182.1 YbjQ family protein [Glaesserella parasuis]MCT8720167.1 YbjQ family protein [Glaesserella parasuis]MCT8726682.1 YbjQ family protein [Glaesserella parasuis]
MIITTTPNIENHQLVEYKGLVFGEVVSGANFIRDFLAGITDVIGGRSGAYESKLNSARKEALQELEKEAKKVGANAVVGVSMEYQSMGGDKGMFIVVATGTAVVIR